MMNADLSTLAGQHLSWKEARRRIEEATPKLRKAAPRKVVYTAPSHPLKSCGRVLCDVPFPAFVTPVSSFERIALVQKVVAEHFGLRVADILSTRRSANVTRPRQIAMFLAKMLTPRSLPEISRRFGNRHHTTALHSIRKIEALIAEDQKFAAEVEVIELELSALL